MRKTAAKMTASAACMLVAIDSPIRKRWGLKLSVRILIVYAAQCYMLWLTEYNFADYVTYWQGLLGHI